MTDWKALGLKKPRKRSFSNSDSNSRLQGLCKCGHKQYEHECHPDEHCYKCECKQFVRSRRPIG